MPTYEYRCNKCGKVFDAVLRVSELDKKSPKCPHCGSKEATRVLSTFTAQTSKKS